MNHTVKEKIKRRPIEPKYSRLTPVESESHGQLVKSCEYVEFDNSDNTSKFNSADFALGNLITIGAFGGLSYVSMSLNSDMNFVDEFAKTFNENTDVTSFN